jgi:RNA polymerase sigma-70 factor (ECF subfamily)
MSASNSFAQLMSRVRAGEPDAAAELVRAYEPEVRRAIRAWLTDPGLARVLDSMDICQSVLANFFVRAAAGQFELDRPEQLLGLLVQMARNKLRDQARRLHAARRDQRRLHPNGTEALNVVKDDQPTPSQVVAERDLLRCLLERLSPRDRNLAKQRAEGRSWVEIGTALGIAADTVRVRLQRAIDRVARDLHLDEVMYD